MARQIPTIDIQSLHHEVGMDPDPAITRVNHRSGLMDEVSLPAFERQLAGYIGVQEAIGVASGSDALWLALQALAVGRGDAVITVPNAPGHTGQAIRRAGALPLFVDIDLMTGCMDVEELKRTLQFKCRCEDNGRVVHIETGLRVAALLPTHLNGLPADMPSILHIGRCYQLPILEDACRANGARCLIDGRWQRVGSFGAAAAFSFSPSETKGSVREAGAVVTNDSGMASKIRWLRDRSSQGSCRRQGGSTSLESKQAAALAVKLSRLDESNRRRRRAADGYREVLAGLPLSLPIEPKFAEHVYRRYVVRAPDRDLLQTDLAKAGVFTALHDTIPLYLHEGLKQLGYANGEFPCTERWAATTFSLPMHPDLSPSQIRHIGAACREILRSYARNW